MRTLARWGRVDRKPEPLTLPGVGGDLNKAAARIYLSPVDGLAESVEGAGGLVQRSNFVLIAGQRCQGHFLVTGVLEALLNGPIQRRVRAELEKDRVAVSGEPLDRLPEM